MSQDLILKLLAALATIVSAIVGGLKMYKIWADKEIALAAVKAKENSLGATALVRIDEENRRRDASIAKLLEDGRNRDEELELIRREVKTTQEDYKSLLKQLIDRNPFMPRNSGDSNH